MKTQLLLIALIFCSAFVFSQSFAPVGAKWTYSLFPSFSGDTSFLSVESVGDTLIHGHSSQIIEAPGGCLLFGELYVYSNPDQVFLYQPFNDSFQLLYDFNMHVGDSWYFIRGDSNSVNVDTVFISVDSIYTQVINSITLRSLAVTYTFKPSFHSSSSHWSYQSTIVETFGDINYLFNFFHYTSQIICDEEYPRGLRCYSDNTFGNYESGIVDSCNHYGPWVGIEEFTMDGFELWPNPAHSSLNIQSPSTGPLALYVFDITGKVVIHEQYNQAGHKVELIDISFIKEGVYFIQLVSQEGIQTKKFIKAL